VPAVKPRVPAVEGWFTPDPEPALLGSRCTACGTYAFPRGRLRCPNPSCAGGDLADVTLSRHGRIWSFTDNRYRPPPPYVASDPFVPYAIAAVELAEERMVVLGQLEGGIEGLRAGDEVELVLGTLYEDEEHEYLVWKWRPRPDGAGEGARA
jgi:uncharacterized OB-fold protein